MSNEPRVTTFGQSKREDIAIKIYDPFFVENLSQYEGQRSKRMILFEDYTTTDTYEDSRIFDFRLLIKVLIQVINKHSSNGIKYKVLGCVDPEKWEEEVAEQTLAGGASATHEVTKAYSFLKVQTKTETSPNHGTVSSYASGKS